MNAMHVGDAEAAGAINGMRAIYGPKPLPSVGQWVQGTVGGRRFSGAVTLAEPGRVVVDVDGATVTVRPSDLDDWT